MRIGAFELQDPLPQLREPHLIALLRPWIDAGNVGTLALNLLERHLTGQELGKLARPGTFFDFTRYRPITRFVEGRRTLTVPNTTLYAVKREKGPDFLFLHLLEPHAYAEEYVDSVVQLLKTFGVKRYGRIGGMYDAVPHTRPLLVTGTLDGQPLPTTSGVSPSRGSAYQGPTSIMNLVSDSLEALHIESLTLMVHLPQYLELEEDYSGTARLLQVLCDLYDLPAALADPGRGQRQYAQVSSEVEQHAGMKALIRQLETYYDSKASAGAEESSPPLSPQVQNFLRDMGQRLEGS
jgi:hypothetical protein